MTKFFFGFWEIFLVFSEKMIKFVVGCCTNVWAMGYGL